MLPIDSWPVFLIVTLALAGGCAAMTGQALANTWRPAWQMVVYGLMLGMADRFLAFALFGQSLLSPTHYLFDAALLVAIGLIAYRKRKASRMVRQYPWLYEAAGPFGWRQKS